MTAGAFVGSLLFGCIVGFCELVGTEVEGYMGDFDDSLPNGCLVGLTLGECVRIGAVDGSLLIGNLVGMLVETSNGLKEGTEVEVTTGSFLIDVGCPVGWPVGWLVGSEFATATR